MSERVNIGDWCTLYYADSIEIVDTLSSHAPDAVIMDPPYGIGFKGVVEKTKHVLDKRGKTHRTYKITGRAEPVWIIGENDDDAGEVVSMWISRFPQVLLWGADHLRAALPAHGRFLAWDKLEGMEPSDGFADVEFAWHSRNGSASVISHMWKGFKTRKDCGEHPQAVRDHPMQKPIRVMEWCITQCRLEPDATILDPYMGSGTTALAAFKRRMNFVGVEIDRRWFDVAVERIQSRTGDGPLFEATPDREPALLLEVT